MATQWHINGDYMLGCNCDYGCPCNFSARPTEGDCQGSIGFHVEDGAYDGVSLNGLNVFLGVKWPGAIHEGEGTVSIYIDESGSPEQRDALLKIVSGEAAVRDPRGHIHQFHWPEVRSHRRKGGRKGHRGYGGRLCQDEVRVHSQPGDRGRDRFESGGADGIYLQGGRPVLAQGVLGERRPGV